MTSFHQRECLGCRQPCDGLYCYPCTCQQCRVGLTNGICLNCTYRDRKPLICCKCEGPLRGGFCWFCASKAETLFANDPNSNSFDDSQNLSDYSLQPQYETYLYDLCGNDLHYGYDCPPRFPFIYEQEPSYNQSYNENYYPHNSLSFLCCDNCGGPHESFQFQPMNQNYFEPNPCYEPNSSSFDQFQPPQYSDEALLEAQREQELRKQEQAAQEKKEPPQNSDFHQLIREICGTKVCEEQKQNMVDTMLELLKVCRQKELYCMHNDVDDLIKSALNFKFLSINLKSQRLDKEKKEVKNIVEQATKCKTRITESLQNFRVIHKMSSISNTTIPETESHEVIKSSVENLVPIPSESEVTSDNENECDVPVNDQSSQIFMTFSNTLIDCNDDFTSSDDKSLLNKDVPIENFKIYLNSLFNDEESISTKIDPRCFNAESNLIESLLNRDTLIDSSPKFDYLPKEFSGELVHIDPIPPGIEEADFDLEEEIRLVEKLFDSQMEEIDLFLDTDDLMPSGIENDDYDSEGDIHFLEELLSSDLFPLPEYESSNFDHHDDPSFPRPPPKPPDVQIFFDFEPDMVVSTAKVVEDISEHHVLMPKVLPSQPTLCLNFDTLLPFSFENEDKVFKPGILSYLLVSHQDKITFAFSENPMMMYGEDIPYLDVLIAPYLEASRARGFVYRPLKFQSLAYGNPIS
nr:hypothetical protein [Tanacetum cinerariifolium]